MSDSKDKSENLKALEKMQADNAGPKEGQQRLPPGVVAVPLHRVAGMGHGPVISNRPRVGGVINQNIHPNFDVNASKEDASKEDASKEDASKEDASKTDASKTDASKNENH